MDNNNSQLDGILNTAVNSAELVTDFVPAPIGSYLMTPMKWDTDTFANKEMGKPDWVTFKITMRIDNPDVAAYCARDEVTVVFKPFINFNEAGQFDEKENIAIASLWTAAGANEEGSVSSVAERMEASMGVQVGGRVTHRYSDDGETAFAEAAYMEGAEGFVETDADSFPEKK